MIHPAAELRYVSEAIGLGVFARELIPRGTITWARDSLDLVLLESQLEALPAVQREAVEKYVFGDTAGNWLLCWDLARYVNHSCAPTCRNIGARFDVALRDIQPGEQITSDYAELNISEAFDCLCGEGACRHRIFPDDRLRLEEMWRAQIAELLPLIHTVPQPLAEFVANDPLWVMQEMND